jgi:phosphoribosyl 1,2-cyclic phosphodiesterase
MIFTPLASSSRGNAYTLDSPGVAPLLLECGIPIKQLREKLGFSTTGLAGCLVSHAHMDHAKAVKDLIKAGVDCYMHKDTAAALGVADHYRIHELVDGDYPHIDGWNVLAFDLEHDVPALGYFIEHAGERCLFVADTAYIRPRFKDITILVLECNNLEEVLSEKIVHGYIPTSLGHRIRRSHMNLARVIDMLKANDLSKCREIFLIHLSDGNSDEAKMIKEVQRATGIPTYACGGE